MKTNRTADFSNPYSKSNKKIISHISRFFNHPDNKSKIPGKSPHSRSVNTSISNIPEIEMMKSKNKLILGKERMQKIKYSLQVDETSKKEYENRIKNNNYYLKYQHQMPASVETRKPENKEAIRKKISEFQDDLSKLSNKEIYQALTALKEKSIFQDLKKRIDKTESIAN